MTTTITDLQRRVLLAFPGGASAEGDNGASWTEVADLATAGSLTKKQVMGCLGSLSTKGLIYADEEKANGEKGTLQCLTDDGARMVGILSDAPKVPLRSSQRSRPLRRGEPSPPRHPPRLRRGTRARPKPMSRPSPPSAA